MNEDNKKIELILTQWEVSVGVYTDKYQKEVNDFLLVLNETMFEKHCFEFETQKELLVNCHEKLLKLLNKDFKNMHDCSKDISIKLLVNLHSLCQEYSTSEEDDNAKKSAEKFFRRNKITYELRCPYCGHFLSLEEAKKALSYSRIFHTRTAGQCPICRFRIRWPFKSLMLSIVVPLAFFVFTMAITAFTKLPFFVIVGMLVYLMFQMVGIATINYYLSYISRDDIGTKSYRAECEHQNENSA